MMFSLSAMNMLLVSVIAFPYVNLSDILTTPTGKPVGFSLPSVARNRTSFSDFGVTSIILFE